MNGARPSSKPSTVKTGDAITAGPAANAKIVYANGCSMNVAPGTTVTVVTDEQCALTTASISNPTALPTSSVVLGGAAIAAGAVGVALAVKASTANSPTSP